MDSPVLGTCALQGCVSLHELPLSWVNVVFSTPWNLPGRGALSDVNCMNFPCPGYLCCTGTFLLHELLPPWYIWCSSIHELPLSWYMWCVSHHELPLSWVHVPRWSVFHSEYSSTPLLGTCGVLRELPLSWVHVVCFTSWTFPVLGHVVWAPSVLGIYKVIIQKSVRQKFGWRHCEKLISFISAVGPQIWRMIGVSFYSSHCTIVQCTLQFLFLFSHFSSIVLRCKE